MKNFLLFLLIALLPCRAMSYSTADSLLKVLKSEIARKNSYDSGKEKYIMQLKQKLSKSTNLNDSYQAALALFGAFKQARCSITIKQGKATQLPPQDPQVFTRQMVAS